MTLLLLIPYLVVMLMLYRMYPSKPDLLAHFAFLLWPITFVTLLLLLCMSIVFAAGER